MNSVLIIYIIIYLCDSCYSLKIDHIFSPSPDITIKLQQTENTLSWIALSNDSKLLFLAAGNEGIIVVDGLTHSIINTIVDFGSIEILSADQSGKYLFFSYKKYISVFEILITQGSYNLKFLSSDETPRGMEIQSLHLFNNDSWGAGVSGSMLIVYDISNKLKFNVIGQLDLEMIRISNILNIDTYLIVPGPKLKIIKYLMDENTSLLKLYSILESDADYYFSSIAITSDKKFIYGLDVWGGFFFSLLPDIDQITEGKTLTNFIFDVKNWWPNPAQTPQTNEISLTKDENFILIGVHELGIFIFDISTRSKDNIYPQLFQWIRSSGQSYSIKLSHDESYLYYANGFSFQRFSKVEPNFNRDYPNLFNLIQANFTVIGNNIYRWRCYITSKGKYMIGAFDKSGIFIFDMENDPLELQLDSNIVHDNALIDSVIVDEENGFLISLGNSIDILLFVYSFPVISDLPIASLIYGNGISIEGIRYNKQKTMIGVAAYNKLILVNSSKGLLNLSVYSELNLPFEVVEVLFSNDDNYLLGVSRNYGVISFDISDPTSIIIKKSLKTAGGYSVVGSHDGNYAFIGEGSKGIGIIDMNQLPNIVFISRLSIGGTVFHITSIKFDSFLLVSSNIVGFISLVDIRDKFNLQIVQKFEVNDQNGLASCASPDDSYSFLTNYSGVTSIPLVSDLLIHTQLYQVLGKETSKILYQFKSPSTTLLVGQIFQMQFYVVYPPTGIILTNIYYYDNFEVVALPFWMNMNSQQQFLDISVDKVALSNDVTISSLNTVILEYKTLLPSYKFLFNDSKGITTTKEQSELIHEELRSMNLLDFKNLLVLENFERQDSFTFKSDNSFLRNTPQPLLDRIKKTLQKSISYNSVMFKVSSSLKFYENPTIIPTDQGGDGTSEYFVFSIQSSVQLYLQTTVNAGKFVQAYYEGVIAQISNFDTHLKLEGSVKNINQILKNCILFYKTAEKESDINFHLIIVDGVNYVIEKDIKLSNASQFIKLKQNMQIKQGKQLQSQFNELFSGGSINIEESISFEFSKDTFVNPDTQTIIYTAYFMQGGEYVKQLPKAWIQQSSNSLRFFGLAPASQYRAILRIKVEAFDGYTSISDEFNLYVYGVPFIYIISTLVKVFGPILTVMGLYKYRSYFFNIVFSKKNLYKKEIAYVQQPYKKTINIISTENMKAILLFNLFLKKLSEPENFSKSLKLNLSQNSNQIRQKPLKKLTTSLSFPQSRPNFQNPFIYSMPETKSNNNNFYSHFLVNNKKIKEIIHKIIFILLKSEKIKDSNQIEINFNRQKQMENQFIDNQGELKIREIINKMKELKLKIKLDNAEFEIEQLAPKLINPTSRLNSALKSVISRNFLERNPLLFQIYQFFKESALIESKIKFHSKNDWYLKYLLQKKVTDGEYLKIQSSRQEKNDFHTISILNPSNDAKSSQVGKAKERDNLLNEQSFSQIEIDIVQLQNQISIMKSLIKQFSVQITDSLLSNLQLLPFKLIYSTFIADYQGLVSSPPSVFAPSVGESIHMNFFDIQSVQAFKKVENLNCMKLRRIFGSLIMNYGTSKNQQLPSWMKFSQQQSAIILYGTPNSQDVESFIIRIFDETGYIARQFEIEVQDQENEQEESSQKGQDAKVLEGQNSDDSDAEVPFEDDYKDINLKDTQRMNYLVNVNEGQNQKFNKLSSLFIEECSINKDLVTNLQSPKSSVTDRFASDTINEEHFKMIQQRNQTFSRIHTQQPKLKDQFM